MFVYIIIYYRNKEKFKNSIFFSFFSSSFLILFNPVTKQFYIFRQLNNLPLFFLSPFSFAKKNFWYIEKNHKFFKINSIRVYKNKKKKQFISRFALYNILYVPRQIIKWKSRKKKFKLTLNDIYLLYPSHICTTKKISLFFFLLM